MRVIEKLWGTETVVVNDAGYCGKIMDLKPGFRCSLHYHEIKDETFYVLEGTLVLESGARTFVLTPGMSHRLKPFTPHRFHSPTGSRFIEFSSYWDEDDVVRLTESEPYG